MILNKTVKNAMKVCGLLCQVKQLHDLHRTKLNCVVIINITNSICAIIWYHSFRFFYLPEIRNASMWTFPLNFIEGRRCSRYLINNCGKLIVVYDLLGNRESPHYLLSLENVEFSVRQETERFENSCIQSFYLWPVFWLAVLKNVLCRAPHSQVLIKEN